MAMNNINNKNISDKTRAKLNVGISIFFKIILLVAGIFIRRYFVRYLGNEVNGISSLYTSLIGFLSVAELGIGTAISFCMYKPIVNHDENTVSALYNLFKKLYLIIGIVIFTGSIVLLPFLPALAKGISTFSSFDFKITFILSVLATFVTYLYSAQSSLINAYKNNYIVTTIHSVCVILQYTIQLLVVIFFKSFVLYLIVAIATGLIQWIVTVIISNLMYKQIIHNQEAKLFEREKKNVVSNIRAMFFHQIGSVVVNSIDGIIISSFISAEILGLYNNYVYICSSGTAIISLLFIPLTSIVGHFYLKENGEKCKTLFYGLFFINVLVGFVAYFWFYINSADVITIIYGSEYIIKDNIVIVLTINYFIQYLRQTSSLFRNATGTFYNDRYKPLIEVAFNILFSILFAKWLGVVGVLLATILTNLFITITIESYVVFKHVLKQKPILYFVLNYSLILLFSVLIFIVSKFSISFNSVVLRILFWTGISLIIGIVMFMFFSMFSKRFRRVISYFIGKKEAI